MNPQYMINCKLFNYFSALNIDFGPEKETIMMTGLHRIRSIKCKVCR